MAQVFSHHANNIARASLLGFATVVALGWWIGSAIHTGAWVTRVDIPRSQPVPFSHKHHVSGLGLDCRYCHTSVEQSGFAGIPPTKTCMTCHSQIWTNAPVLQPVRMSWRTDRPIQWQRVHDLPSYVYFNHSIHVAKGIGCNACHGQIDQMPITMKVASLHMQWCLNCHRHPEKYIRPKDQVFNMAYTYPPPAQQLVLGRKLVAEYHIDKERITNCSTCHR